MIFSFHSLYPSYAAQDERLWGLSAVRDQQLAGIVMMVEQLVTLGLCVAFDPARLRAGARAVGACGRGRSAHLT